MTKFKLRTVKENDFDFIEEPVFGDKITSASDEQLLDDRTVKAIEDLQQKPSPYEAKIQYYDGLDAYGSFKQKVLTTSASMSISDILSNEYEAINQNQWSIHSTQMPKGKKPNNKKEAKNLNLSLSDYMKCFDELLLKQIGNIYISGSIALSLQGKIKRTKFDFIEIICTGEYILDDDITEAPEYLNDKYSRPYTLKPYIFNNTLLFIEKVNKPVSLNSISYNGNNYLCKHYIEIIEERVDKELGRIEDFTEIYNSSLFINVK